MFSSQQAFENDFCPVRDELLGEMYRANARMALDVIKAAPDKRQVASIVSCRKKYLSGLLSALESCGVRPFRAEPHPCALLRYASQRYRAPRK